MSIIRTVPEHEATDEVAAIYYGSALQALAVDVDVPSKLSESLRTALVEDL